ncbi:MAG: putative drug exporter of the superfamily, partial [Gaiellales bacterium]|nr:putative drug exporter of the superfamily [Gaiellales bacterium]
GSRLLLGARFVELLPETTLTHPLSQSVSAVMACDLPFVTRNCTHAFPGTSLPLLPLPRRPEACGSRRGLSMDYDVFIISRIRETFDRGASTDEAIADGIKSTAGVVTSAALVMVSVFAISVVIEPRLTPPSRPPRKGRCEEENGVCT